MHARLGWAPDVRESKGEEVSPDVREQGYGCVCAVVPCGIGVYVYVCVYVSVPLSHVASVPGPSRVCAHCDWWAKSDAHPQPRAVYLVGEEYNALRVACVCAESKRAHMHHACMRGRVHACTCV